MEFTASVDNVRVTGRTLWIDDIRYLSYSGSSVSFSFIGNRAKALIKSDTPDQAEHTKGFIAVYVNEEEQPRQRICLDAYEDWYTLYESDGKEQVTIHIVKYSEEAFGKCGIKKIAIEEGELLPPPLHKKRRIEIIGDSITCGYGVEADGPEMTFRTDTENPTKSYSMLLAKALDAEPNLVSWSGIGITSNWVPEDAKEPLTDWLMPMLYEYTDASCSKWLYGEDNTKWEKWDNSCFVPDVIVINLGTNDCSYCKDIAERKEHFKAEYKKFVETVRRKNPGVPIVCTIGTMDGRLLEEERAAVEELNNQWGENAKLYFIPLPSQDAVHDGLGADYHPSEITQRKTAEILEDAIRKLLFW